MGVPPLPNSGGGKRPLLWIRHCVWVITFRDTQTSVSLVFDRSPVAVPGGSEIYGSYVPFIILIFFGFSGSCPLETREPIHAYI